ncbi:MAG TPA: alpha/beta hydrolase [Rhizomicrobium sp.]
MPQVQANGIDIEYESFGRKTDPAVVLIMGYAAQMTMWPVALCEGLATRGFRVIRFDNRDAGLSTHLSQLGVPNIGEAFIKAATGQKVDAPYTLNNMAADTVGLLDALGIGSAHMVGASMGGMIAQIVAAEYPARTRSLVSIMSTTGRRDLPQGRPEVMAVLTTPPPSDSREDRIAQGRKIWAAIGSPGFRPTEEEITKLVEREVDRAPYDPVAPARQLVAVLASEPRNDMLEAMRVPSLVIHGADDPLVPVACGEDTAASIPGSELIIIPGMGHDFASGLVPLFLEHIGNFLARVERRKGA